MYGIGQHGSELHAKRPNVTVRTLGIGALSVLAVSAVELERAGRAASVVRLVTLSWWTTCAAVGWLIVPRALRAALELFDDREVNEFLASSRWLVLLWCAWLLPRLPSGWGFFLGSVASGVLVYITNLWREHLNIELQPRKPARRRIRWSDGWRAKRVSDIEDKL